MKRKQKRRDFVAPEYWCIPYKPNKGSKHKTSLTYATKVRGFRIYLTHCLHVLIRLMTMMDT